MKFPIEWHETNLANLNAYIERLKKETADSLAKLTVLEADAHHRQMQITKAKELGKDGFDSDKFLCKFKTMP